jgi:hypothetical protein
MPCALHGAFLFTGVFFSEYSLITFGLLTAFQFINMISLLPDILFPGGNHFLQMTEAAVPVIHLAALGFGFEVSVTESKDTVVVGIGRNDDIEVHISPFSAFYISVKNSDFHSVYGFR